ncbi:MAG: trypsin-like serine protease, partial [Pseudomonadota bacterium]
MKSFVSGLFCAVLLISCDQVRLPGADDLSLSQPEAQPAPTETASVSSTPPPTPQEQTETQQDRTETDNTGIETASVTDPVILVSSLAEVNAALCGLPLQPQDPSLTLAERTGAEPMPDDLVGVAAVNASAASLRDFPGLVKMEPREFLPSGAIASGHCSATRIAEHWFVTAAHCLDDDYDEVDLIVGVENLRNPMARRIKAVSSVCHAAYGGAANSYFNDIALVRVSSDDIGTIADLRMATFSDTDERLVPVNYGAARMAGWGLTDFRGSLSDVLLTADLTITGVGPGNIGVASVNGAGPCIGDSGGPLFIAEGDGRQSVVGVLSVV